MTLLAHDLRCAVRQLRASPGFAAAAVAILALGIGLNAAVFSLVNATLFRPLPVVAPEELVAIYTASPGELMAASPLSTAEYLDLGGAVRGLGALFAYCYAPMALERGEESRLVLGVRATAGYFSTLGLEPALGRFFGAESAAGAAESAPGDEAVLSYLAWRRRFGADPRVLGQTVRLNGKVHTVVGVAPPGFFGLARAAAPEVWVRLDLAGAGRAPRGGRQLRWLWAMGRREPGVTWAEVTGELAALAPRIGEQPPGSAGGLLAVPASRVRILPGVDARLGAASSVVMGVIGLVLLIASTNVANLVLARALSRRREIATRRALGAGTAAVARQLLAESLLLAILGGGLGLGLAWTSNRAFTALRLPVPVDLALDLALDGRVLLFTLAASILSTLLFGLAPSWTAARGDLATMLRSGASAGGRVQRRLGGLLVVAQVGLSLVLLVDAGLAARSLANAHRVDPGFEPSGVVVATVAPRLQGFSRAETEDFFARLTEGVRSLPGIESVALASHLPLTVEIRYDRVAAVPDEPPAGAWPAVDSALVSPGYFETLRTPVLRGRGFEAGDREGAPLVAVVNQSFAARFWPQGEALGQRLRMADGGAPYGAIYEVVGVVRDGKYRTLGEAPRPFLWRALDQGRWSDLGESGEITTGSETLVARTHGEARAALGGLRTAIHEVDAQVALARLETLEDTLGLTLFLPRMAAVLFSVLGFIGLGLAALGIYGLMLYTAGQRRREIGVRMAVGAARGDILRLVLRQGMGLALAGIGAGLALAVATSRALAALLYGISPTDAPTLAAVALLVAAVALLASLLPARQAAGSSPLEALRGD